MLIYERVNEKNLRSTIHYDSNFMQEKNFHIILSAFHFISSLPIASEELIKIWMMWKSIQVNTRESVIN